MCCLDLICFWWFSCGGETIATSDVKCQMAVNFFTSLQRCLFTIHDDKISFESYLQKKSKGNLEVSKWLPSYKQKGTILGSRLHDPDNFSQQHKKYWENLASSFKKFLAHVCYSKWIIDAEIYYTAKLCKAQSKQNRPSISLLYTEVPTK